MKLIHEASLFGLVLALAATTASAQTDTERAGARAAAEQGVKAYSEGRWSDTIDLMMRAEKLVHAPTHLLYIAQAAEKLGHLVQAHESYLKIAHEKLRPDAPDAFVNAQEEAKRRVEALRGRLSQVTIAVQGNAPNSPVTVTMDGVPVPEALVGVAHPVDPGEHKFEAKGANAQSGVTTVQLREGSAETVLLTLHSTSNATPVGALATSTNTLPVTDTKPSTPEPTTPAPAPERSGSNGLKIGGYVGLGVGVVGVGLGTVFLVQSMKKRSDANSICSLSNGGCPESRSSEVKQLDSDATSAGNLAVVGYAVGGVGLAAGVTMLLLSRPSTESPQKAAWIRPYFAPNAAGLYGGF
jgi:hypothetical protein